MCDGEILYMFIQWRNKFGRDFFFRFYFFFCFKQFLEV